MSDELARLRALAERLRRLRILDEVGSDNQLGHEAADGIVRLLDDVERAERERDRLKADSEFLHRRRGEVCIERDAARDRANLLAASLKVLNDEVDAERARAERLEAALKPIAGWWKIWNAGGPTPDEWIVREWMQKADAALAEPGGQDAERAVNAEGPSGTYGCKCTSRNALKCAQQAYYAGIEARELCECLCHQWAKDDAARAGEG